MLVAGVLCRLLALIGGSLSSSMILEMWWMMFLRGGHCSHHRARKSRGMNMWMQLLLEDVSMAGNRWK